MKIIVGYLYGDLMNIYGDIGNIISLKMRAEWRGIEVEVRQISLKKEIKEGEVDLYFFGGGQDQSQMVVANDLKLNKGRIIKKDIERGVPLLAICGGYQLLGEFYQPFKGPKIKGVGLFTAYTKASEDRMIGNIVIESEFGSLIGFENHSGKTYLKEGVQSLGKVKSGFGNNGEDTTEGCVYKNAIGCYMHGSLLPKNPKLADWLIKRALEVKYERSSSTNGKEVELKELDDELENKAHKQALEKLR